MRFLAGLGLAFLAMCGVASAGTFSATIAGAFDVNAAVGTGGIFAGNMFVSGTGLGSGNNVYGSYTATAVGFYAVNYDSQFAPSLTLTVPNSRVRTDSSTFEVGDKRYLNFTTYSGMVTLATGDTGSKAVNGFVSKFRLTVSSGYKSTYAGDLFEDNLNLVNNPPGKPSQNFGTRTWEIYTDSGLTNVASKSGSTYQLTSGTDYFILVKHTSGTNKWDTGNSATDVGTNGANLNFVFTQTQDTSGGGGVVPEPASLAVFGLMGLGGAVAKWRRKK